MIERPLLRVGVLGAIVAGLAWLFRPGTHRRHVLRSLLHRIVARAHYAAGRCKGACHRMCGRAPAEEVADDVLADRVRSTLGPVEKRLDLPHVHVMVEDGVAILHGDVANGADALTIETAVEHVPGVKAVDSRLYLHLLPGDSRPSEGHHVAVPV